jgi:hypothetical protein
MLERMIETTLAQLVAGLIALGVAVLVRELWRK